jgi:hypothetical protein
VYVEAFSNANEAIAREEKSKAGVGKRSNGWFRLRILTGRT